VTSEECHHPEGQSGGLDREEGGRKGEEELPAGGEGRAWKLVVDGGGHHQPVEPVGGESPPPAATTSDDASSSKGDEEKAICHSPTSGDSAISSEGEDQQQQPNPKAASQPQKAKRKQGLTAKYLQTLAALARANADTVFASLDQGAAQRRLRALNQSGQGQSRKMSKNKRQKEAVVKAEPPLERSPSNEYAQPRKRTPQKSVDDDGYYEKVGSALDVNGSAIGYEEVANSSHKYLELVNNAYTYSDISSALYSDVGGAATVSTYGTAGYDDLAGSSVHTYLSLNGRRGSDASSAVTVVAAVESDDSGRGVRSSSEESSAPALLVTARPAVVLEDQEESIGYVTRKETTNLGTGLYESIAGSLLNLACKESGESVDEAYSNCRKVNGVMEDEGEGCFDPREVLSYTLAKLTAGATSGGGLLLRYDEKVMSTTSRGLTNSPFYRSSFGSGSTSSSSTAFVRGLSANSSSSGHSSGSTAGAAAAAMDEPASVNDDSCWVDLDDTDYEEAAQVERFGILR